MEHLDIEAEKEQIGVILLIIDQKLKEMREKLENQKKIDESQKSYGFMIDPSSIDHVNIACKSCDSLNKCSICMDKEHVSASTIIEYIKSIQTATVEQPQDSCECDSFAFCVECKKFFAPSKQGVEIDITKESCLSFITCEQCQKSKTSVATNPIKVIKSSPISCQSLAYCILCQKQYLDQKKSQETNLEPVAAIKSTHSKIPSCASSLNVCSFCQMKLTKGISHFKSSKVQKDLSQIQPIADIIQSIYYSQADVEPPMKNKTPSKSQSKDKASIKENKAPSKSQSKSSIKEEKKKKGDKITEDQTVQQDAVIEEISRKPLEIKPKVEKYQEKSCDLKDEEEVTGESASQIIEKHRLERLKQEQERKKNQDLEAAKNYEKFLTKQKEEMVASGAIKESTCSDDGGEKIECGFIDDCVTDSDTEHEPVDISKKFLVMKYEIEMQNYKISKLCQELKVKKKKGAAPFQLAKIKDEIKKDIKKLKTMIEYTIKAQKENPNEMWGSIPISSVSFTKLERQSYDFEKVEMPKKPSSLSHTESVLSEAERFRAAKEKKQLIKQLELKIEEQRIQCLSEKSQRMKNELYSMQKVNDDLKQKVKFFDSERDDFKPDEKLHEAQTTMIDLMGHLKTLKTEFDDIHLKLHEMKK